MNLGRRVAVTGLGPLCALGAGVAPVLSSLRNGGPVISRHEVALQQESWASFPLAKAPEVDTSHYSRSLRQHLKAHDVEQDRDLLYLLATVRLALDDSGLDFDRNDNEVGLLLTHENPGVDHLIQEVISTTLQLLDEEREQTESSSRKDLIESLYERFRKRVYNLQSFMYLYHVSKAFGLHGFSLFINNACASGLFAIETAADRIRQGRAPAMIVAGADCPRFPSKFLWFRKLGLYADDGLMRPFDRRRNGFILGEGGGAIILEDLEKARRRGAPIYAEYLGGGFSQDAWKVTVPSVVKNFYSKALREALAATSVEPSQIDLINPHGVATSLGDRCEAEAITAVFGEWPERQTISAFKPHLGHNLGGSSLLETILLLLCLKENYVPATLNYHEPDPLLRIRLASEPVERPLEVVLKMANGFAGYNSAAVFRKVH